ncbi:MAG: hypothetical protein ACXWBS_11415 [Chthoniobacterales bacterium]
MQFRFLLILTLALALFGAAPLPAVAQEKETAHATSEEHHLPLAPPPLFKIRKLTVTSSMVVTWVVAE